MHRYLLLTFAILLFAGWAHGSRNELSSSLSIPMPHQFGQESYNSITSSTTFRTTDVKHLETIQDFVISTGGKHGDLKSHRFHSTNRHELISSIQHTTVRMEDGLEVPHGTSVHLAFSAMGQEFAYHLEPMYGMVTANSKVEVHGENGLRETIPLKLQSYFLHTDDQWVSMMIHSDGTFSAVIQRDGEVYQVDPHHVHAEAMESEHHYNTLAASSRHGMTIFRHSDLLRSEDGGKDRMCGAVSSEGVAAQERGETIQKSHIHAHHQRSLLQTATGVDPFNCGHRVGTSGYAGVTSGQVVDYGMYLRANNPTAAPATATVQKATDYVQSVYAQMNAVYAPQLLLMLQLNTIQVETTHDQTNGKLWNVRPQVVGRRCDAANGLAVTPAGVPYASDIEKALTDFSAYVGTAKAGTNSFWHQMSNCYPPSGVVGIAYVGSMCQRLRTGVSTFSTTTYLTMAHEIAHNFGADHTFQLGQGRTGGIMDYNLNTFRGVIQFNIIYSRADLCNSLLSLSADPTGARRLAGGVQPYCIAALNAPAGTTLAPVPTNIPVPATNAPATVRPTVAPGRNTPYTLAQIAQHRTAQDCWVAIGRNVYDITRWNGPGVHPAGAAVITARCGTDATRVYNENHQNGATYLTTLLARDVIGVLTTATPTNPPTPPPATPRPVTAAPTTSSVTPPPTVTPPGGIMYFWAVTAFSTCPVDCEGTQTRMVVCVNGNNRNNLITVPDTFCLNGGARNGPRPPSSQACGISCPVRFAPIPGQAGTCQGANGATCSAMAGGQGVLSQPVQCVKTQNKVDVVVADAVCLTAGISKPATNTPCNLPTCAAQYTWAYGMWSGCSATCGGGTETRRVACVSVRLDATTRATIIELAESSTCQSMFGNPPVSSRACNTQACVSNSQRYQWTITSNFTECSAPCGGGQQTRTAYCTDGYMKQVVPGYQCPNAPVLTQPCNTQACAVYVWVTGRAGQCSAPCGPSTANRPVTCVNQNDRMMTPLNTSLCLQSEKPAATVPCNLGACPTGTTPAPTTPPQEDNNDDPTDPDNGDDGSSTPKGPLAVYALNTIATHAIPSDCWAVVNKLVYNLSYFGLDPVVDGVSHPVSGSLINAICGTDVSVVFSQVHKAGTSQLPIVTKRLIGKVGANTPDPVFPPPIGNQAYAWYIDTVGIQCGPTPVDKCTVVSTSTPKCVNVGAQMVTIDSVYCAKQPNPATDPNQPRVGQPCPVNAQNPNPCTQNNPNSAKHRILSSISSSSQSQHPLSRRTVHITAALSGSGPQWLTGIPSQCTVMCGGGTQVRNVTCVDGATGATLPSTSCDALIKPSELLECGMQPCNAFWSVGPWNQCSAPCGGIGTQTREVDCRSSASSSGLGLVMGDAQCLLTAAKPSTQQTCNAQACPQWVGGAWTECSELCGVGVQTLAGVRCENSYGLVVDDAECLASSQFNRMRPCNAGPCPVYDHGPWGQCSATCGGGNQTREVLCRTKNHNAHEGAVEYNMTICDMYDGDGRAKGNHVTQQACNEQPCGDLYWKILPTKFQCSAACDGGIVRMPSVCMKRDGNTETQVADDVCLRSTMASKPKEILDCNTQPCAPKYAWDPSKWSECSSFCGDGTQTREVTCIDLATKTVSPGKCSSSNPFATIRACTEPVSKCWGNVRKGEMKNGECIVDPTSPLNGTCQCRSGWAGNDCSVNPGITNVYFENTKYAHGIPVGVDEKMVIRWNSYGSNKDVSILLLRDDNTTFFAQYLARGIANTGVFEWSVGSILDDLPFANKYVVQVMMKNTAFGRSARFQTADACQYKACGMNAVCQSGKCVCQPGYTGANCQISPCEKLGCDSARSTCDNTQPACKCAQGWTGPQCKTPVSCVDIVKCANGGDYIHPVDMPVTNPLTCPLDASDVTCDCQGSWTNTTCNVCGLKCMNGGVPNGDCTSCNCPAGYTGDTCSCRYYDIKAKLNYDTSKWTPQTLAVSSRRLQQTFANDMAAGIVGLNANQFIFTSFAITGSQIDIGFRLTDQCSFIAPDLLMTSNPRIAMAISGGVDPTKSGSLQDIYQQLLAQLKSLDSVLLQGYITSSIVPGSVVVTDPLARSTQQPEQPGRPSDPFGPAPADNGPGNNPSTQNPTSSSSSSISIMLIGIIVGGVVGVLLLVGAIIYFMRMRKSQSTSKRTLTKVSLDQLPSGHTSNPSPTSATPPRAWDSQPGQQNYQ